MTKDIHTKIKEDTRKQHADTEKLMDARKMFSPDYTLEDYISHLKILYNVHAGFELAFDNYPDNALVNTFIDQQEFRTHMLKEDIEEAGSSVSSARLADISYESDYEIIGGYYVIKGSQLGGRMISKEMEKKFPTWNLKNQRFYSEGSYVGMPWSEFKEKLNQLEESKYEELLKGAQKTFSLFRDMIEVE